MKRVLLAMIDFYQRRISPALAPRCRFHPSCSHYAAEALRTHGTWKGLGLTLWRLARCQPFCRGGYDPVPPSRDATRPDTPGDEA